MIYIFLIYIIDSFVPTLPSPQWGWVWGGNDALKTRVVWFGLTGCCPVPMLPRQEQEAQLVLG